MENLGEKVTSTRWRDEKCVSLNVMLSQGLL